MTEFEIYPNEILGLEQDPFIMKFLENCDSKNLSFISTNIDTKSTFFLSLFNHSGKLQRSSSIEIHLEQSEILFIFDYLEKLKNKNSEGELLISLDIQDINHKQEIITMQDVIDSGKKVHGKKDIFLPIDSFTLKFW
jgi:hypothetical protein